MRSAAGGTLSDSPTIDMAPLYAETPPNLASLISTTAISAARTQLLSGGITTNIMYDWKQTLPTRLHQKLYRAAHKGVVTHQHNLWLARNAILHLITDTPHQPTYGRKRKINTPTDVDTDNSDDTEWKRTRLEALDKQAVWKALPKYRSTTNRRRKLTLLANPTALPKLKRRRVHRKRPRPLQAQTHEAHIKRRHIADTSEDITQDGRDGEGSSDPSTDNTCQDNGGPSAPLTGTHSLPPRPTEGSHRDSRGRKERRCVGTQGPPPSATGGG
jgi:hypothetical protein